MVPRWLSSLVGRRPPTSVPSPGADIEPVGVGPVGAAPLRPAAPLAPGPVEPIEPVRPVGVAPIGPVAPIFPVKPPVVVPVITRPELPIAVLHAPVWTSPVAPGTVAPQPVTVSQATLQSAIVSALASPYAPVGVTPPNQVIWYDHDGQVLVQIDATVVTVLDGLVLVALSLATEETGVAQVTVPLTVGTAAQPVGMIAGTENRPRGPSLVIDRWGQAATAAAWGALLAVATNLAAQGGADVNGVPFVPAAMMAALGEFSVSTQARQTMDSVASQ